MKYRLIIHFALLFPLSIFSQTKEGTNSESIPTITIGRDFFDEKPIIDTLYIKAGKPIVFLVDIDQYTVTSFNEEPKKEKKELVTNFGETAFQIKNIKKHTYLIFENKQTLDMSVSSSSYSALAYWSGNLDDTIKTKEGISLATEFISKQIGAKKESSYVINARKHKEYITNLKNNSTAASKQVMNAFLSIMLNPLLEIDKTHAPLFRPQGSRLKKIETYISQDNASKNLIGSIDINKSGQPTTNIRYNSRGLEKGKSSFIYKNGILVRIIQNDRTAHVYYDDDSIVIFENIGDADEIKIGRLENNILCLNSYVLMIDDMYAHRNYSLEEKTENNCVVRYLDTEVSLKNCSSTINKYPFFNKETRYQGEEILNIRSSKLEKKDETTFEIYHSTAQEEGLEDDFQLWCTLRLNKQKLISTYSFIKNKVNTVITFDYTYY